MRSIIGVFGLLLLFVPLIVWVTLMFSNLELTPQQLVLIMVKHYWLAVLCLPLGLILILLGTRKGRE